MTIVLRSDVMSYKLSSIYKTQFCQVWRRGENQKDEEHYDSVLPRKLERVGLRAEVNDLQATNLHI